MSLVHPADPEILWIRKGTVRSLLSNCPSIIFFFLLYWEEYESRAKPLRQGKVIKAAHIVTYCFFLFPILSLYMFLYLWCTAFPYFVFTCFCISDILLFFVVPISHLYSFYILLSVISYFVFYIFLIRPSIFIVQSLQLLIEPRASMIIGKGFAQLISAKIGTNHLQGEECFFYHLYLYLYFCIWNRIC